ncbi:uncharacterized protein CEXT_488741 [Caerostris extrusa]|uniref:Uncharacterized protein n=1 Tax=Caerostris extrusa TaxID=172846 RepID=A0AAV4Y5E2_CAEEX|nr:uncharacterized protein CEXT_488741 [Caerostris extrusa]
MEPYAVNIDNQTQHVWFSTSNDRKYNRKFFYGRSSYREFPIFYAYSDIVQPVVVGHVEAPLLRVVRISGKDGDVINALYDRPHYVPVIRQSFQTIEIEIRLNSGSLVPFEGEKSLSFYLFQMRQIL